MKKTILKLLSVFSLFLLTIILATVNTYASTSTYDIATNFIFTTDMNVEEGFELIKPYILIKDGFPSSESFTFDVIPTNAKNEYTFKGKYPNGETFTAFTYIKKIYKNKKIRFYLLEYTFYKRNKTNKINYGNLSIILFSFLCFLFSFVHI